ncbi:MAG: ABC transporter permease [Saccharofermentanales bacterium]|jgi:ABC-2 type transport system permease protein|nr:ABC transporter permease [Bacillota bacterium]
MKNLRLNIKYIFLETVRDKGAIFWLIAFPILLSTFFFLAFQKLDAPELTTIKVAAGQDNPYYQILETIEVLDLEQMDEEAARTELEAENLVAYIKADGSLLIKKSGVQVSIIKGIMDQIVQMQKLQLPPERYDFTAVYTKDEAINLSSMQYFMYTLIGMISIYSYFTAVTSFSTYQANISTLGARLSVSPLSKGTVVITSAVVSLLFCFLSNIIALVYIQLVLGVTLVSNFAPTILILFAASLFGVAFGAIISTSNKLQLDGKVGLGTTVTLILSFFTGMMNPQVKHFVEDKLPLLARFNPVTIVNDALVSVNVLAETSRIYLPLVRLVALSLLLFLISMIWIGRRSYDSI